MLIYSSLIAFLICLASIWLLNPLAKRLGLIDTPSERKHHYNEVPLIGGIAVFIGFAFALLTVSISLADFRCLIAVSGLLVLVGMLDDFHELSPRAKFVAQIAAALLTVFWGNNKLNGLGEIFLQGKFELGYGAMPLTVLAIVGIINAFNMIDGIDGLATGIGLITLIFLGYFAFTANHMPDFTILSIFASSLIGFLCFNFPLFRYKQASVFLGDAGSMLIGFILVWFLISLSQANTPVVRPVDMLWLVAIPIYDVANVILKRLLQQRSPFTADRNHFHHLLLFYLKSSYKVCLVMYSLAILFGFIAVISVKQQINEALMLVIFIILFIFYLIADRYLWKALKKT